MLALLDGKFLQIYKFKPKILFNRKHSQYWYFYGIVLNYILLFT